jgi:alpha-beta hydrolase superfamily lysophospholipase
MPSKIQSQMQLQNVEKTKDKTYTSVYNTPVWGILRCNGNRYMAELKYSKEQICGEIPPLNSNPHTHAGSTKYYFDYFGLAPERDIDGVEHLFGTFESEGFTIAAHIYRPANAKGTVVIMHGYLNHCGQLSSVIPYLLENGYAVCAYDMPGHGLSTGKAAWMDNFDKYAQVMQDFKPIVAARCPGPYSVMAFSHGACAVIQTHLEGNENFFDKTILIAPLVRPIQWRNAQFCYRMYWPFRDSVPRLVRKNTSDSEFLDFNRSNDFLHKQRVPLIWVRGLEKWNAKVTALAPTENNILLIQGDKDATVDWKYNTKFLSKKFDTKEIIIENAKHELLNEKEETKNKVFAEINSYLATESEEL